ncbi:hypothetical protein AC578_6864 [Pseudocercospora eumusae]|uniref:Amino acid transporter transmembrane domain-containing protein n=1 Tax=Pseudocercospora eumusae TaxID=321146 RepID=A0A139GZ44_9PEZI|nr:hypothetical protein AC578_6864 [Pseudocercospora eumusae]
MASGLDVATISSIWLKSALSGPGGSLVAQLQDGTYPEVQRSAGLPDSGSFIGSVNSFVQAVYAYRGARIFCELMAEMRRPRDFLKTLTLASGFIWFFYMFFGLCMYAYQGQYDIQPAMQGLLPYGWQTSGNVLSMISSLSVKIHIQILKDSGML